MILLRAMGDTIPPPPSPSPTGVLHITGYDWAVRVLHSSAFIVAVDTEWQSTVLHPCYVISCNVVMHYSYAYIMHNLMLASMS